MARKDIDLEEVNKWHKRELKKLYIVIFIDALPRSIRKCIYTTNWIERVNKELKRRLKTKDGLPTIDVAEKIIYMQVISYNQKWSQRKMRGLIPHMMILWICLKNDMTFKIHLHKITCTISIFSSKANN